MKQYVRNKFVFNGTSETLNPLVKELASNDGKEPLC